MAKPSPEYSVIFAQSTNMVIGQDSKLPWNIPDDLKRFKELTLGNTIIMGRRTFESLKRPLPHRYNIVISNTLEPGDGYEVCKDLKSALLFAEQVRLNGHSKETFIIGGADLINKTIDKANKLYLTLITKIYPIDNETTVINRVDLSKWKIDNKIITGETQDHVGYCFIDCTR